MINPYLQGQANAITSTVTDNLKNNILPSINQGALAAGGFGGSRHGVMQGLAIGQTNLGLGNALTNLYGNAYAQDQQLAGQQQIAQMNDATSRLGLQNQYDLGLRNAGTNQYSAETSRQLGQGQLDANRYQFDTNTDRQSAMDNFQRQLASAQFGQQAMNNQMNWQNMALGWANQQQQTPLNNLTQLGNLGIGLGGMGGTSAIPYQGNPWLGALGGAQLGQKLFGG